MSNTPSKIEVQQMLEQYLTSLKNNKIMLYDYAIANKIPIIVNSNMDKGWKGNAVEHLLNIKKNNRHNQDLPYFEIKTISVTTKDEIYKAKETMCLSVLDPNIIISTDFKDTPLFHKIKDMAWILIDVNNPETPFICDFKIISLNNYPKLLHQIEQDYQAIASHITDNISNGEHLTHHFTGHIGELMQPRPKTGKNKEYTWAFFFKLPVLNSLIKNEDISKIPLKSTKKPKV